MPPPPLFSFELDCTLPDFLELWDARYAEYLAAIGCRDIELGPWRRPRGGGAPRDARRLVRFVSVPEWGDMQ